MNFRDQSEMNFEIQLSIVHEIRAKYRWLQLSKRINTYDAQHTSEHCLYADGAHKKKSYSHSTPFASG